MNTTAAKQGAQQKNIRLTRTPIQSEQRAGQPRCFSVASEVDTVRGQNWQKHWEIVYAGLALVSARRLGFGWSLFCYLLLQVLCEGWGLWRLRGFSCYLLLVQARLGRGAREGLALGEGATAGEEVGSVLWCWLLLLLLGCWSLVLLVSSLLWTFAHFEVIFPSATVFVKSEESDFDRQGWEHFIHICVASIILK